MKSENVKRSTASVDNTVPLLYDQHKIVKKERIERNTGSLICCPKNKTKVKSPNHNKKPRKKFKAGQDFATWQNYLIYELIRLRDENGEPWIDSILTILTEIRGPNGLPYSHASSLGVDMLGRLNVDIFMTKQLLGKNPEDNSIKSIRSTDLRNGTTLNSVIRYDKKGLPDMVEKTPDISSKMFLDVSPPAQNSLARTIENYESHFANPRSSNVGLVYSRATIQRELDLDANRVSTKRKGSYDLTEIEDRRVHESQPVHANKFHDNDEIDGIDRKASLNSYDNGDMFKFLNNESDEDIFNFPNLKEEVIELNSFEKMMEECIVSIYNELNDHKSFFTKLINVFSQTVVTMYEDQVNAEARLQKLIENVRLFCSYLSNASFKMFEDEARIIKGLGIKPEEAFIPQFLYFIFTKTTVKSIVGKETTVSTVGEVINRGLRYFHQTTSTLYLEAIAEIKDQIIQAVPPMLSFTSKAIEFAASVGKGDLPPPEFLVSVKEQPNAKKNLKGGAFDQSLKFLYSIGEEVSPYHKLYFMMMLVEQLPKDIEGFYLKNGLRCTFQLSQENVVFCLASLLCQSPSISAKLSLDILLTNFFLTESLHQGKPGFCIDALLHVHDQVLAIYSP